MADEEARVELSEKLEETRKESEARGSRVSELEAELKIVTAERDALATDADRADKRIETLEMEIGRAHV